MLSGSRLLRFRGLVLLTMTYLVCRRDGYEFSIWLFEITAVYNVFFLFYRKFSFKMSFNDCAIYVWSKDTRSGLFLADPFPFIPTCPGIHIILILGAC